MKEPHVINKYEDKNYYRWAIIEKKSCECIGQIAFCELNTRHRTADIEYCIGPVFQRKGYASEALRAVVSFSFYQTGIHRLQAFHRGRNSVSGKVLERAGFLYEGTLKESFYYEESDEYDDRVWYGLVRKDFIQEQSH